MKTPVKSFLELWIEPFMSEEYASAFHSSIRTTSEWFWNTDFWLPVNFTWKDIEPTEELHYPNANDIWFYPLVVAVTLLLLKVFVIYPYICFPVAKYYGLNFSRVEKPKYNPELESLFIKYGHQVPDILQQKVAKKLRWNLDAVDRWLVERKLSSKVTVGERFTETLYMALCHSFICFAGYAILYDEVWVEDITNCWEGYPYHEITVDVWGYYIFMLGFYWSITISQIAQPKRKDSLTMIVHHMFTIVLMSFSWTLNLVRVGSLVILVHQSVDWLLLTAKLCNYLKKETLTNIFFGLTFIIWIITRILLFPFWIMRSALFVGPTYMFMPSAYLFYGLMVGLLLLNIMWMKMMICIVWNKVQSGKFSDARSSEEDN